MRGEERQHTVGEPIACCAWQPADYYTAPLRPFEFPTTTFALFPSNAFHPAFTRLFPTFELPPCRTDDTIVPLSIYIPFSLALRDRGPRSTPYAHIYRRAFVRSTSNFSLPLSLSPPPLRHTVGILRSFSFSLSLSTSNFPPCHTHVLFLALVLPRSDGAPADFAFKFGKFAGVGKWAVGMVSNTRARARPPIHCV